MLRSRETPTHTQRCTISACWADRAGNERDAMNYYRRALRIVPDYEPAARGVSTIQIRGKRVQDAVATVEPLANEYRANLEMQALYAEVLVEARRLDEAWMARQARAQVRRAVRAGADRPRESEPLAGAG